MFRIGICEDNKNFVLELKEIIYNKFIQYNLKCEVQCFYLGEDLLDSMLNTEEKYDIIFFDIELPKLNGIEVARKIRDLDKDIVFIFITYLNEKVYEALDLHIFHFIRKDHFYEEIDPILESLIKRLDYLTVIHLFPINNEEVYFKLYDILYFEVLDRQLILHTKDDKYITNYRSLKDIPFDLVENQFHQVYRGIVVNLNHVKDFIDDKLILSNDIVIYIARRRRNSFKEKFYELIASKREG
ncbi:MAG: LytR/AlgR family response regulator transcription factor [Tissierella sp.]|uniref:LytR/AlgR family response regulator transcription factor n=1 Tax=Tissierella sp. TaxID=41274 RepID=UPI003F98CF2B